ncbi:S-type pyocin domain-containing protein [Pseudomonas sp. 21LCFQ010]|uniref:S-type pyocin domain-containing protein n=1 Tax=Pseudomonas sp. 21LCFQ010 TaxID=2957506 RepID=UPI002097CB12|nr:S-type pyocin domain-containing protein [Pseudomonas sp. 21LCFQ010]MCO8163736.1 S-type pyocin domain-containing protein [Pseudomonas sp. 21LCFQ010]
MQFKERLQDYTRAEFASFLNKIWAVDVVADEHDLMIEHFDRLTAHIRGCDLLFYPDTRNQRDAYSENETALGEIQAWYGVRKQQAFKDDVPVGSNTALDARGRAQRELDLVVAQVGELDGQQAAAQTCLNEYEHQLDEADKRLSSDLSKTATADIFTQTERHLDHMDELRTKVIGVLNRYKHAGGRLAFSLDWARRAGTKIGTQDLEQRKLELLDQASQRYHGHKAVFEQRHRSLHERAEVTFRRTRDHLVRLAYAAKTGPSWGRQTLIAPLFRMDFHPRLLAAEPTRFELFDDQWQILSRCLRSAVTGLAWELDAPDDALMASILGFSDSRPGCGDPVAFSVPLRELMSAEGVDWHCLALANAHVEMPYRVSIATYPLRYGRDWNGLREVLEQTNVCVVRTDGAEIASSVRVRMAVWDELEQGWRLNCPDGRQREVLWYSHSQWAQRVGAAQGTSRGGNFAPRDVPEVESADLSATQLDDYVAVFPVSSGLEPVYLSFTPDYEYPGVVVGQGQRVAADWLNTSAQPNAVPSQVADILQGQVFDRFRLFLVAFWQTVASLPELCTGFDPDEKQTMAAGQVSRLSSNFRIGFIRSPLEGGDIYDLDNLQIVRTG